MGPPKAHDMVSNAASNLIDQLEAAFETMSWAFGGPMLGSWLSGGVRGGLVDFWWVSAGFSCCGVFLVEFRF
jgi:hypothetical protein